MGRNPHLITRFGILNGNPAPSSNRGYAFELRHESCRKGPSAWFAAAITSHHSSMGKFFQLRTLALLTFPFVPSVTFAQATIRPIPSVGLAWEGRAVSAAAKRNKSASTVEADFSHLAPLEVKTREAVLTEAPEQEEDLSFAELEMTLDVLDHAGSQGGSGDVATYRAGWQVNLGEWSPNGTSFAIELGTEGSFYDFGGGSALASSASGGAMNGVQDPFNDVYETRLGARFLFRRSKKLSFYGGVEYGISGEDDASLGDASYGGGALAMRYDASPKFALLVGVAGVSRFDDSAWILPYLGFEWRITEDLRLKTEAAEVHFDYDLNEEWTLGLEAVYGFRQYRLNEDGPLHGGSFRDEEIRGGIALGWQVTDAVQFDASIGKMLWREVRFHDGDAGFVGETELGKELYASFGLKVSF
jgi:hypothetical protein